jgi:hypothetical protein
VVIKPLAAALAVGLALAARAAEPAPQPSAAPPAQPVPFRYVGRVVQNGKAEALLLRGAALYSLAEGEEIDGEYRVERIGSATIRLTYLPTGFQHELDLR